MSDDPVRRYNFRKNKKTGRSEKGPNGLLYSYGDGEKMGKPLRSFKRKNMLFFHSRPIGPIAHFCKL